MFSSIVEQQREAESRQDYAAFHEADERFHATIADISDYPGIWRLVLQVKTQVDRYHQKTLTYPHRMAVVIDDHEKVLEALSAGDAEAVVAAMMCHLQGALPKSGYQMEEFEAEEQTLLPSPSPAVQCAAITAMPPCRGARS